jgi:hypothetical protein
VHALAWPFLSLSSYFFSNRPKGFHQQIFAKPSKEILLEIDLVVSGWIEGKEGSLRPNPARTPPSLPSASTTNAAADPQWMDAVLLAA